MATTPALSNYATTELVNHVFKTAYTPVPATVYLALLTATPDVEDVEYDNLTEVEYEGYEREAIAFSAASSRTVIQNGDVEFGQMTAGSPATVTHYAILDHLTTGNVLAFGAFDDDFDIVSGNTPKVASTEVQITIGGSSGYGFTDIAVDKMLNMMFRNTSWTSPSGSIYFGLTSGAVITDSDTLATIAAREGSIGANGYGRVDASGDFDAAVAGVTKNNAVITFPSPSGDWFGGANMTSLFICDDSTDQTTSSDLLAYDSSNVVDQPIGSGDTVNVQDGDFACDLD